MALTQHKICTEEDPFAVKLLVDDNQTIVEPDISAICDLNKLTDKGCTGAPDWIIEIVSPSTSSYDYIRKLNLNANAGVKEYWIVDPAKKPFMCTIWKKLSSRPWHTLFKIK